MTSLETSNFQFPLFAAGDVTSWLVDFNGAMRDIDTALAAVKTTAETAGTNATAAQGSITQINQQLVSINNTLSSNSWTAMNSIAPVSGGGNFQYTINNFLKLCVASVNLHATGGQINGGTVVYSGAPAAKFAINFHNLERNDSGEFVKYNRLIVEGTNITVQNTINSGDFFSCNLVYPIL